MIQRIQTVYLLFALILIGLMGWLPFGEILVADQIYTFSIKGILNNVNGEILQNGIALQFIIAVVVGIQIAIIFWYKKRIRQMRLATYNIILMLGIIGVCFYFFKSSIKDLGDVTTSYNIALVFPIVAAILNYLAIRAIAKDEALVRSIDRIR